MREIGDRDALEFALVENVQREDLNALEEADGYQRLIDEFGYTQEALAQRVGKSRSHVANTLRLLSLPERRARRWSRTAGSAPGHARALLGAPIAVALAREAVRNGMSVRQVENAAQSSHSLSPEARAEAKAKRRHDPNVVVFEKDLAIALGTKVTIRSTAEGGKEGELVIHYKSFEQLDDFVKRLKQPAQR